jgi:hypothetical protein
MEEKDNGGFIGGLKKVLNMYVKNSNKLAKEGLTITEFNNPIKPIINTPLKDTNVLGMKPLTYLTVSFGIVAVCGIAILTLKNK